MWALHVQRINSRNYNLPGKYKPIHIANDINDTIGVTVGDWVLSEDHKIAEHNQV